jgi:hypothetical protein
LIQSVLPQLSFSFYRHQPIHADFSGGQITSDAGLLPLRAFDQQHHLTSDWAVRLSDPRQDDRVRHDSLALLRQRVYQIVAGYEDANDSDRLRHDPLLQIVADQKLGHALGSQPRNCQRRFQAQCALSTLWRMPGNSRNAAILTFPWAEGSFSAKIFDEHAMIGLNLIEPMLTSGQSRG